MTTQPPEGPPEHDVDEHVFPHLRVVRDPDGKTDLYIDNVRFPHPIASSGDDGFSVRIREGGLPGVNLTLVGASVQVEDRWLTAHGDAAVLEQQEWTSLAERAPQHPSLRWLVGDDIASHRRRTDGKATLCGRAGPFAPAPTGAPVCSLCRD